VGREEKMTRKEWKGQVEDEKEVDLERK